jgi:hypothetical protein
MRAHSGILLTLKVAQVFTTYDFYAVCMYSIWSYCALYKASGIPIALAPVPTNN